MSCWTVQSEFLGLINLMFLRHCELLLYMIFFNKPKCCEYNNKDEDNSPKALNNKNHEASSQKFRQLITLVYP